MQKLNYSVRSREIVSLINDLNGEQLILKSYFQRNLVWRDIHRKEFIDTILKGLPFPQIFLARGGIDVDSLQSYSCVVDGQQRLSAIRDYVAGEFDVDGNYFSDLSQKDKEDFLKYEVAVIDFDLDPEDERLNDIFQRLNRTYYSLSAVEKLSAEFAPSDLMVVAKTLVGEFSNIDDKDGYLDDNSGNPFSYDPNVPDSSIDWATKHSESTFTDLINSEKIFSLQESRRKVPLMAVLNIICTAKEGYYNRNNEIKKYLEEYKDNFEEKDYFFKVLNEYAKNIFLKLEPSSLWLNKANFYSICVELLDWRLSEDQIEKFRDILINKEKESLPASYSLAAREGVNNKKEREVRGEYLKEILKENFK